VALGGAAVQDPSAATGTCCARHVFVNGSAAKAASQVLVGDRLEAHLAGRNWVLEVGRVIDKRMGAPQGAECVIDHSPPAPGREERAFANAVQAVRRSGIAASSTGYVVDLVIQRFHHRRWSFFGPTSSTNHASDDGISNEPPAVSAHEGGSSPVSRDELC